MDIAPRIEAGLDCRCPEQWQRLAQEELKALTAEFPHDFILGWRVDIPSCQLQLKGVDHLFLVVDKHFPHSQPRIIVPGASDNYHWPHVEKGDLLCLEGSSCLAPVSKRIEMHLSDAITLLNYSEQKCIAEFDREFLNYWLQGLTSSHSCVFSLVTPHEGEREIFFFHDSRHKRFIVGDHKPNLVKWLKNSGFNPGDKNIMPAWLSCLPRPWTPSEFPERVSDILKIVPLDNIYHSLTKGQQMPILFEVKTKTGSVFVAVVIDAINLKALTRGFRNINRVPAERIQQFCENAKIERCEVSRVDGAWIHGRDHGSSFNEINHRTVAIVGCGAIGASLARLLAQAGVGRFIFVDHDRLTSANTSRHLLGIDCAGDNKADLLHRELSRQFPHLTFGTPLSKRFEYLSDKDLGVLESTDLIVACGLDLEGKFALDKWRSSLSRPPAYLSTWTEAYAVAGHAVLLYGNDSILTAYDVKERFAFRLTNWPDETRVLIDEAGCGNAFQPYGVVDLYPTTGMAAKLALDHLLDRVPESCRCVWMGDPSVAKENGGEKRGKYFTDTMTILEFPWRDSP